MIEAELSDKLVKLKASFELLEGKIKHLDPKADAILAHLVKSKWTLCWVVFLVLVNTAVSIWIGLKL